MTKPLAVITGASSGIGKAFARRLAPSHDLLLIARREDKLTALANELTARSGSVIKVLAADLTDEPQLNVVAERIAAEPELALLINNAGFGIRRTFWETDLEILENMHRLHVMAVIKLSHAALRVLVAKNRGALINVASVAAFAQRAGSAGYGASKSWLSALTEGLYLDLKKADSAVAVQALCPGFTYSEFHDIMGENRLHLAPAPFWMTADRVVEESLAALARGTLFVIPGWRYRWLTAVLTKLPIRLRLYVESRSLSGRK